MIRFLHDKKPGRRRQIGPNDHGSILSLEDYESAIETPGYVYEIIDGVLTVSPSPLPSHDFWVNLLDGVIRDYSRAHSNRINYITQRCDIIVPRRLGPTRPQPDLAAYRFPARRIPRRWDEVSPILIAEVVSPRRDAKDIVRNRHLYWLCRGIREYWIIDPQEDAAAPAFIALSRATGRRTWIETVVPFGDGYRSPALPGLNLNLKRAWASWRGE